jgi:hypothetical protein
MKLVKEKEETSKGEYLCDILQFLEMLECSRLKVINQQ